LANKTWADAQSASVSASFTSADIARVYSNDPGASGQKKQILITNSDRQSNAWSVCRGQVDATYGAKRLPRRREQIAASVWPRLSGEPGAMSSGQISVLENGSDSDSLTNSAKRHCLSNSVYADPLTAWPASGGEKVWVGSTGTFVVTGSNATSNCVSRFGIQDMPGNGWHWLSDRLWCGIPSDSCVGVSSSLDSGNSDIDGFRWDGVQASDTSPKGTSSSFLSAPLGFWMLNDDLGNAVSFTTLSNRSESTAGLGLVGTVNVEMYRGLLYGTRLGVSSAGEKSRMTFTTQWSNAGSFHCVLPAE
jgi:hypothetical protein